MAGKKGAKKGADGVTDVYERVRSEFEELGLSPYEARVLLGMLKLGSATTAQLETVAGLPRTSTYRVLQTLATKGLAERVAADGPAVWSAVPRDSVLERICEAYEDVQAKRMRQLRARADGARALLNQAFSDAVEALPPPSSRFLHTAAQLKRSYEEALSQARAELVMFTRPPYTWHGSEPNPVVLKMLERGVATRVLYLSDQWEDPAEEDFRAEMDAYHHAGVEARLAERLPVKLIVVDRHLAIVNMADSATESGGYPTMLHVDHAGFAELQVNAFEQYWQRAAPLTAGSA